MSLEINLSKEEPVFTISAAAKILNISVPTLRYYEKEGLIIPFKKESGQRLYSQKDIERIECIRKSINEKKISVNGIKAIFSLISCWEFIECSEEDRKNCPAFSGNDNPCWSYKHEDSICSNNDCRECAVYKNFTSCTDVKELLKKNSGVIK